MSEHTPLTEAEREDICDSLMEYRWGSQPAPERAEVVYRTVEAILAARTSTATADRRGRMVAYGDAEQGWTFREEPATADTGLRERVEALIEAGRESLGGTNLMWVSDLQDALDATASTEDRADNEGTR